MMNSWAIFYFVFANRNIYDGIDREKNRYIFHRYNCQLYISNKIDSKAYDVSKIWNLSNVMTFNEQIVLCLKLLSEHFQFNKANNNNHRGPSSHYDIYILHVDIHNTFPEPMLS